MNERPSPIHWLCLTAMLFALGMGWSAEKAGGLTNRPADTEGHPHEGDIEWAIDQGLLTVFPDGRFLPDQPITRGQLATVLRRFHALGGPAVEKPTPPPTTGAPSSSPSIPTEHAANYEHSR